MSSDVAIHVQNLHKNFGQVRAVRGISFDVQKGEIFSLIDAPLTACYTGDGLNDRHRGKK